MTNGNITTVRGLSARRKSLFLDKAGYCIVCGYDIPVLLEVHHIVPLQHGGEDTESNLVAVCPTCHTTIERLAIIDDFATSRLFLAVSKRLSPDQREALLMLVRRIIDTAPIPNGVQLSLLEPSQRLQSMLARISAFVEDNHGLDATYHRS